MIRTLEELSLNALPALQTLLLDGWVLRFAAGYTRRANSVQPLYASGRDLAGHVAACEALYTGQGLRPVFKLTPVAQPAGLDDFLAARGYRREAPTSVQTLSLADFTAAPDPELTLQSALTPEWLAAYQGLAGTPAAHRPVQAQMLAGLLPTAAYAGLAPAGRPAACGLGVLQDGWLGLFDIVTAPEARRQGLSRRLVAGLLNWGRQHGARHAYLQVMTDNAPALGLYAGLGFREVYTYWYRALPPPG